MGPKAFTRLALCAVLGCCVPPAAQAQSQAEPRSREDCERLVGYRPTVGQEGKDVMWAPTPDEPVARMLRMARTGAQDFVVDLGAGDGKIAIAAARQFGARSLGIEYNPQLVRLAQCLARVEGVAERARIVEGDIFKADFSQADVVTVFMGLEMNRCLRHRLLAMRPGVRVVSYQFTMDDWEPDEFAVVENNATYLWIVPARVGGTWAFRQAGGEGQEFTVRLSQIFQKIGGDVTLGEKRSALVGATLHRDQIRFAFSDDKGVQQSFAGRIASGRITGEMRAAGGTFTAVTGVLQGAPHPAPWGDMAPQCATYYGK